MREIRDLLRIIMLYVFFFLLVGNFQETFAGFRIFYGFCKTKENYFERVMMILSYYDLVIG